MPPELDNDGLFAPERDMGLYCGPHPDGDPMHLSQEEMAYNRRVEAIFYLRSLKWKAFKRMGDDIYYNMDVFGPMWWEVWTQEYDRRTLLRPLQAAEPARDGTELLRGA